MTSKIRFIRPTKFDHFMFEPVAINENEDGNYLRVKVYDNDRKYVFIKESNISNADKLVKGGLYAVQIKSWVHAGYIFKRYHLTLIDEPKPKTKCLFI